ncbi:hypothetical protein AHAS_Ahas03G0162800 [Arachis hypogaea]
MMLDALTATTIMKWPSMFSEIVLLQPKYGKFWNHKIMIETSSDKTEGIGCQNIWLALMSGKTNLAWPFLLFGDLDPNSLIRWYPPTADYLKVNVDGSFYSQNGNAACGGIFRDNLGRFVKDFACNLGSYSIMHVELWGIIKGLQIAIDNGYNRIVIESDSMMAINFIKEEYPRHRPCFPLLDDINVLSRRLAYVAWKHILHEANNVVDILARKGQNLPFGHQIFYSSI